MKIARRFYVTHKSTDPQMADCTWTVSGQRAMAKLPPAVRLRFIISDIDDKRAALKLEGSPDELVALAVSILDIASDSAIGSDSLYGLRGVIASCVSDYKRVQAAKVKA